MQYVLTQEEYDEHEELIRLGRMLQSERVVHGETLDGLRYELASVLSDYSAVRTELDARQSSNINIGTFDDSVCDILTTEFRRMRQDTPSGCGRIINIKRRKRANGRGSVYIELG